MGTIPSLNKVRNMSAPRLRESIWLPVVNRIINEARTTDPQGIADYFVKRMALPPIKIVSKARVHKGKMRHELGGTFAVLKDGSFEIGLPNTESQTEQIMFLRHEIQHHIDRNKFGFEPLRPHPFDRAGQIQKGHHKDFALFNADFPHAYLTGKVDIFGNRINWKKPLPSSTTGHSTMGRKQARITPKTPRLRR